MAANDLHPSRLMSSGRVKAADVHRGMQIVNCSGEIIGFVAGVIMNSASDDATHLLIGHLPPNDDYRLTPVDRVSAVGGDWMSLDLSPDEWNTLPRHQPE